MLFKVTKAIVRKPNGNIAYMDSYKEFYWHHTFSEFTKITYYQSQ